MQKINFPVEKVLKLIDNPDKNKTVSFFDWLKELKEKRYKNKETEITNKIVEENSVEKNGSALDKDQNVESQQNDNDGNKVTQKITSEEKIQCQANNCHNLSTKIESSDQKQLPIEQETENGEKQVEFQQNVESEQQQSPQGQVINTQCQLTSQHTEKQNLQAEIENKKEECYEYLITSLYDNLNNNPLDLKEKSNEIQYYTEEVVNMLLKVVNQLKKDVTI